MQSRETNDNPNKKSEDLNDSDCPQELFVEGVKGFYAYNNIIKFNIISRPVHNKNLVDSAKILATITMTQDNYLDFVNYLTHEAKNLKSLKKEENKNHEQHSEEIKIDVNLPPKGNRII